MNILFVHEIDWLRKVVYEIHTLPELLSLSGHNVYAIDYESMWVKEHVLDFGRWRTRQTSGVRAYQGASVTLIRPGFVKIPVWSRVTAFATHYMAIRRAIEQYDIDVIVLYSVPTNGLQTVHIARQLGIPVVFRSIDVLHQLVQNRLLSKVTCYMERAVYARADWVLTISPALSRYVVSMGAVEENVRLLPLGMDMGMFQPNGDTDGIRWLWGLGDKAIVFVGTLPMFSGLDTFICLFPAILEEVPEAQLLIVGDGIQRPLLEKIIGELGLQTRVIITGYQPYESMPQFINAAAVCINPFSVVGATRDIFPTKVIQYMACGKPVVSSPLVGLTDMIHGEEQGIRYAGGDMGNAVISLLQSSAEQEKIGQRGLAYVRQHHSYDRIVQQFVEFLREAV